MINSLDIDEQVRQPNYRECITAYIALEEYHTDMTRICT